jgi:Putative prokaryotic signal transducing protein
VDDIIEIATFGTAFEARAAAAHLASEDIRASVLTDNAGGTIPSMSLLEGGVRLVVTAADAERARKVLEERVLPDEDIPHDGEANDVDEADRADETSEWS